MIKIKNGQQSKPHINDSEHVQLSRSEFKQVYFSSCGHGRWRGGATFITAAVNLEKISGQRDKDGRFLMLTGKVEVFLVPRRK